ncbi:hypothetical protein DMC47_18445 [Nostoc sp. 3335mG]|nr:hypothetical protein DMC47_18445 [Nostoc sp. 3335mG]
MYAMRTTVTRTDKPRRLAHPSALDLRGTFATRCMVADLTDQEIADILGWTTKDVWKIRSKYMSQHRVVIEIGKRIAATKTTAM